MRILVWLARVFVFFTLFAFALNNQAPVELHFFFGQQWQAPMVLVVLATFVAGMFAGIAVMLPLWLAARRQAKAPTVTTAPRTAEDTTVHGT